MVSDEKLIDRIGQILKESDLETTTTAAVRRLMEDEFGLDLYSRRAFIRHQIDQFLNNQDPPEPQTDVVQQLSQESDNIQEDEEEEEEEEKEEEEEEEEGEDEVEIDNEMPNKKRRTEEVEKDAKRKGRGFSKPCALSPKLQELLGEPELARTEVVKRLWAYIREKDLQNPKDRRKILCDEPLREIFKVNSIDMFRMNKELSRHIWPIEEEKAMPVKSSQKEKPRKPVKKDEPKQKEKRQSSSGLLAPLPISEALVKFLGSGEVELSRADVVKRMWQYIKQNELQDPSDKRRILCDDKLKELFEVDSFNGFTVSKLLTPHFIKTQGCSVQHDILLLSRD